MSGIPAVHLALITSAIEDYQLITPSSEATPAGLAEAIGLYLASGGLALVPATDVPYPTDA